ncbi:MAG: hypothetical protein MIO92_12860 [Methanosarcinaceae archaeon]|nr:hypothetical protein [Methanosarcinaceae archaeon]
MNETEAKKIRGIVEAVRKTRPQGIIITDVSKEPDVFTVGCDFYHNELSALERHVYIILKIEHRMVKDGDWKTQTELAKIANVTRMTFYKTVQKLDKLGYVRAYRGGMGEKGKAQLFYELKKRLF